METVTLVFVLMALGVTTKRYGFQAKIGLNKKMINLGSFKTPEEAHQAYIAAKRVLHQGNSL